MQDGTFNIIVDTLSAVIIMTKQLTIYNHINPHSM